MTTSDEDMPDLVRDSKDDSESDSDDDDFEDDAFSKLKSKRVRSGPQDEDSQEDSEDDDDSKQASSSRKQEAALANAGQLSSLPLPPLSATPRKIFLFS